MQAATRDHSSPVTDGHLRGTATFVLIRRDGSDAARYVRNTRGMSARAAHSPGVCSRLKTLGTEDVTDVEESRLRCVGERRSSAQWVGANGQGRSAAHEASIDDECA